MKKKFLSLILTAASGLLLSGLTACGGTSEGPVENPTDKPSEVQQETKPEVDNFKLKFEGKITLKEVEHDVALKLYEDLTAKLVVPSISYEKTGTYAFIEGIGYEFTITSFDKVTTTWSEETKEHVVEFTIKAGDNGSGTVTLKLKDESFTPSASSNIKNRFIESTAFTGSFAFGDTKYTVNVTMNLDGTLTMDLGAQEFLNKTGTWTYENNTFKITVDEVEYSSTFDLGTGLYTIPYKYKGNEASVDCTLTWNPTVKTFSGKNAVDFGGISCDVYIYNNQTALFDITCDAAPMPQFQTMFDRTLTWTTTKGAYTFVNGEETFTQVTREDGTVGFDYILHGERDITIKLSLVDDEVHGLYSKEATKFGDVTNRFIFKEEGVVIRDIDGAGPASTMFDGQGTYTFENNVISVQFTGEENPSVSTWDEETGTYTLNYSLVGTDMTINFVNTYAIWGK